MTSGLGRVAAFGGAAALAFTYACGGADTRLGARTSFAQEIAAAPSGAPVMVTCEPNQRTLVRPTLVNGTAISQVECVSMGQSDAVAPVYASPEPARPAAVPVAYRYSAPAPVVRGAYDDGPVTDTRVIPVQSYPRASAPVQARQVVYDRPVGRVPVRSVKKSAVIIGSSAGAGAGVGAAIGGKKGALIGAVLGGGGATLWDQVTRHRN
ncbi:MAG: hypothetical protein ABI603_11010 [Acidobacteriota bacterium]